MHIPTFLKIRKKNSGSKFFWLPVRGLHVQKPWEWGFYKFYSISGKCSVSKMPGKEIKLMN